jgi:peroxiredoxin
MSAPSRDGTGLDPPGRPAPAWSVAEWLNTATPLSLEALRGKVVALHAFQMLCPACVQHALPQMQRVQATFAADDVVVVGLLTVFEHHEAMTPVALRAFLHEYRIGFPVGVDLHDTGPFDPIPRTMRAYGIQGTPTLLLIDRSGHLRSHRFGAVSDLALGAAIVRLADG